MQEGPKITIITACYNSERTIEQTIQSVLNQTYENIEYIIVDGASTDGTMDVVEKYRDRIDVVVSEKDRGVYDAFNKGVELATGDYVYYLNSGDYFTSEMILQSAITQLGSNWSETSYFYGCVICLDESIEVEYIAGEEISLENLADGKMIPHQAIFVKRSIFYEIGNFNIEYSIASDFDFLVRIMLDPDNNGKFLNLNFSYYPTNGISSNYYILIREYQEIIKKHFNREFLDEARNNYFNCVFYKKLSQILIEDSSLSEKISFLKNFEVYIFGSMKLAIMIDEILAKCDIECKEFLDNNEQRYIKKIKNKQITKPDFRLIDKYIIIATEGFHEKVITKQLVDLGVNKNNILSWREILYM